MLDVVKEYEGLCKNAQDLGKEYRKHRETFHVEDPNRFAETQEDKIVQMQVVDVLFNDQDCTLVHMQDLTHILGKPNDERIQQQAINSLVGLTSLISKPILQIQDIVSDLLPETNRSKERTLECLLAVKYFSEVIQLTMTNIDYHRPLKDKIFVPENMEEFSPQNLVNELMLELTSNEFDSPYLVLNEMHKSTKQMIMGHAASIR